MGKQRTPTKILELKGAYKKDPQRRRVDEPQPEREIERPIDRKRAEGNPWTQVEVWDELVMQIAPGVLTCMDSVAFEIVCRGVARIWNGKATPADEARVHKMLGSYGMTPSDRSKVCAPKPKGQEYDPFPDF